MAYKIKKNQKRFEPEQLPIYKIKGKYYFRDKRLGEYRKIRNPSDSMRIDDVPNETLQDWTKKDVKNIWG